MTYNLHLISQSFKGYRCESFYGWRFTWKRLQSLWAINCQLLGQTRCNFSVSYKQTSFGIDSSELEPRLNFLYCVLHHFKHILVLSIVDVKNGQHTASQEPLHYTVMFSLAKSLYQNHRYYQNQDQNYSKKEFFQT